MSAITFTLDIADSHLRNTILEYLRDTSPVVVVREPGPREIDQTHMLENQREQIKKLRDDLGAGAAFLTAIVNVHKPDEKIAAAILHVRNMLINAQR